MLNKVALSSLVVLAAAALSPSKAHAAGGYVDGQLQQNRMTCPSGFVTPAASTFVSFYKDPALQFPSTGDVGYMRAVVWNLSPCLNDVNRFFITLPETVSLEVTAQNPVYCIVGQSANYWQDVTAQSCSQTPNITSHGMDFGVRAVPFGWFFELRIPVRYNKWNGSVTWNRQLHVETQSNVGNVFALVDVPINYRPKFDNHRVVTNSTAIDATVAFDLTHYNGFGEWYIAYSTDPNFAYYYSPQTAHVQTNPSLVSMPNSSATLTGLTPNTTYYWRVIAYDYLGGGAIGPVQSFTTPSWVRAPVCKFGC